MRALLLLSLVFAACRVDDGRASPGRDASADSAQAPADAAPGPGDAGPDSSWGSGDVCGWAPPVCLGVDCPRFDPTDGTSVQVDAEGALELQEGAGEGELRHVFQAPCDEQGAGTLWYSVTLTGSLAGVTLDVRGANREVELEDAVWLPATSGEDLPQIDGSGCSPRFLEVRLRLRVAGGAPAPRVEAVSLCYGCTLIFC